MSISETVVEIGREREYTLTLTRTTDGTTATIPGDSLEYVTLNIGGVACLSTEDASGELYFNDDETAVLCKLGMVDGLEEWMSYECWLTVYDADAAITGLPWSRFVIRTVPWEGECT